MADGMNNPAQTHRTMRVAFMTAASLGLMAIAAWTFAAWLRPSVLLALLASFSFCG